MKKIVTIVGARPQFIKASVVSKALSTKKGLQEIIIHTGQHFDHSMSQIFFNEMGIPTPKYNLDINSLSHGAMTGRMLETIEKVLIEEKPELVIVYGDTNSTLAGALAASKLHLKIAHIEAGLRSFNMDMPEEINRILTDRISDLLFCPTIQSVNNLENEGYANFEAKIINVGDVMEDASKYFFKYVSAESQIINKYNINDVEYALLTIHRAENTDSVQRLTQIVNSLNFIHKNIIKVVVPLHPRTKKKLNEYGLTLDVFILEPVSYIEMIQLLVNSRLIITDSGGVQKESYFFNKFCLTLRDETEWQELVKGGYNFLIKDLDQEFIDSVKKMLKEEFVKKEFYYGNGTASIKIADSIEAYLS